MREAQQIVTARAPRRPATVVGAVEVTHPDRQLWPGITKLDLAKYWQSIGEVALRGLARRPLAVVRYPEGIDSERFFQKRGQGLLPKQIREGEVHGSPYLAIDDIDGLIAMAQMSAIEIHPWGATEADPLHPDFIVFDLDPGEGVPWFKVISAALEVRDRLERLQLMSFCRTTGGKGLHVVVPLTPSPEWDWERVKDFCRGRDRWGCTADRYFHAAAWHSWATPAFGSGLFHLSVRQLLSRLSLLTFARRLGFLGEVP